MTSAGQDVNKHQTEYIPFSYFLAILILFLKAKVKTLINTATIQWIHSTTKYHEAKVTTTKKTKDTCTFCFRNPPTGKTEQTFTPFAQPPRRNQPCHQLCGTITKLIHVLILLLTEIPQPGKQGKRSPHLPATQKPRISLQLGWTITELYTYHFTSRLTQHKPYS